MTLNEAIEHSLVLFSNGQYTECEQLCTQVLQIQSSNPMAHHLAGQLNERSGNHAAAFEHYLTAALTYPYHREFIESLLRLMPAEHTAAVNKKILDARATISRFPMKPSLQVVDNPAGRMAIPLHPVSDVIRQAIVAGQIFEPEIVEVARHYIRPGTAVIDVGANFGQMTLLYSKMTGPAGIVYSIEADDYVHHILTENLRLNDVTNVTAIMKAAHERDAEQVFFPDQDFIRFGSFGSYGVDQKASSGRQVETMTIDGLNIQREISFMKVDVQGCDLFAMRGAVKTIHRSKMPIIFEYEEQFQQDFGTSFEDYVTFVRDIGYKFVKTINHINYIIAAK
jgi:FkbM family methyltransferase